MEPQAFSNTVLIVALVLGCLSPILPAILWGIGVWRTIITASVVLCFITLLAVLCSALAVRRWPRRVRSYVAIVVSGLVFSWWCFLTYAFIRLSTHLNE